jgi:hypothetical protein
MSLEDDARTILESTFPRGLIAYGYRVQEMTQDEVFDGYDEKQRLAGLVFHAREGDRPWRQGDARRRFRDLSGFTDRKRGMVAILRGAPLAVLIHELLHASADERFPNELGPDLDEGTTTVLANFAAAKAGRVTDDAYEPQQAVVNRLIKVAGQRALENAYFRGEIEQLRASVDGVVGPKTFDDLVKALRSGEGIDDVLDRMYSKSSGGSYTTLKIRIIQRYLGSFLWISTEEWEQIRLVIRSVSPSELQKMRDAIGPQLATKLWDVQERGRLRLWLFTGAPDT